MLRFRCRVGDAFTADHERAGARRNLADRLQARVRDSEDEVRLVMGLICNGFGATTDNRKAGNGEGNG